MTGLRLPESEMQMKQATQRSLEPVVTAVQSSHFCRASMVWPALVLPLLIACASTESPPTKSPVADSVPPSVRILQPAPGTRVEGNSLAIDVEYADQGSGVAVNSFKVLVSGQDYSGAFDQHSRGASGRLAGTKNLALGENKLTVQISDRSGNTGRAEVSIFYAGSGWLTIAATAATQVQKVSAVALSADGNTIAYGLKDGTIQVWHAAGSTLNQSAVLQGHLGSITALALADEGSVLASGGEDRTVRLWNLAAVPPREGMIAGKHELPVTVLAFAPDGKTLASGSGDRTVRLWSITPGRQQELAILAGHSRVVGCLVFSPDGRKLVSGSADGTVRVWNIAAKPHDPMILSGHLLNVVAVAVAPDGKTVVSASKDRSIRLWDVSGGAPKQKALVEWLDQPVRLVSLPYGTVLLTVDGEDRVALRDSRSGSKNTEAELPSPIDSVALRGSRLVTHHSDGRIYLFNVDYNSAKTP
mgnify:CR=1 FL=1